MFDGVKLPTVISQLLTGMISKNHRMRLKRLKRLLILGAVRFSELAERS